MNTKIDRYSANWEKLSRKLKLLYHCYICGEQEYNEKECHHLDGDKKNGTIENAVVLCRICHKKVHKNPELLINFVPYKKSGYSVTVARLTSSKEEWFDSKSPLKLLKNFPSKQANEFRKSFIKGFVKIGSCNYYIALSQNDNIIGILGFENPKYGNYDIFLKADTTPSEWEYSTDLLLFALRTKDVKLMLEKKFNRVIDTAYSMCFSKHDVINRYRKHGELIAKNEKAGGYDLGYKFNLGSIPSLKAAKSLWMQNHKIT